MLTQKLTRTICSILCGFAFILSPVQAAYAAPVAVSHTTAAPAMLNFTSGGHALGFTTGGMLAAAGDHALRVDFVGANPVQPQSDMPVSVNKKVTPLSQVTYPNLWDGIRLDYSAQPGSIYTTTYHLSPGANPANIRLHYNAPLTVNHDGTLGISFKTGSLTESAPIAWQQINGQRLPVTAAFKVDGQNVGFVLGVYDPAHELVIDPTLLWNTFLGSSGNDIGWDFAVDGNGNIYVSGASNATWGSPLRAYTGSGWDAFVAKLSPSGTLLWNTFLGGHLAESGDSIAVDGSGYVYITCASTSSNDAFVAKLNPSGTLVWDTFLYFRIEEGTSTHLDVDGSGNIFVTGSSDGTWGTPVRAFSGYYDIFVVKLNSSGTRVWNTFLGGDGDDESHDITVDGSGNIYVTGYSEATWGTPLRPFTVGTASYGGPSSDGFVAKINSSGALLWNTFLGSSNNDSANHTLLDGSGNIYITGYSTATWGTPLRPFTAGTSPYGGPSRDGFVAKINSSGALLWNTFLGSSSDDGAGGTLLDGSGNVFVTGGSNATWGSPLQAFNGGEDAFIAKLSPSGTLLTNTFLGGSGSDSAYGIVKDGNGNVYITGISDTTWGTPLHAFSGSNDAFVAKVDLTIPPPTAATLVSPLATMTTANPTFIWSKVSSATYYRLWVKNAAGAWVMQNLYYGTNICGATNCAVTPTSSLVNGVYTWYIQTLTATQNGTWSAHSFTVAMPAPGKVTLVSPKDTIHTAKPTFIWSKDSVSTLYRLWIKNNTTSAWVIQNLYAGKNICGLTNCAIVSPVTLANGSYTWYIDTLTATQNGQWSAQAITVSVPDVVPSPGGSQDQEKK